MLPLSWEWKKKLGTCSSLDLAIVVFSLLGAQLALRMSSGWRLTAFSGLSKKLQRGCVCGFLKAVVVVPKQLGPGHRSFHLKSWADLFRALWMNHSLPARVGEGLTVYWIWVIQDGWSHLEDGLALRVVVRGSESGSGVESPAGGTAFSLSSEPKAYSIT